MQRSGLTKHWRKIIKIQSKISTMEQQQTSDKASYLDSLQRLYDKNAESSEKLKVCFRLNLDN